MLKYLSNNVLVQAFVTINALLNHQQKKNGIFIFFLLFLNAFTDVIGLGMIYPLIDAALNPDLIQEKFYFRYLYDIFKIKESTSFILLLSWIVFFVIILKSIVNVLIIFFQSKYVYGIALSLNKRMLRYYYAQGFLFLKNQTTGEKIFNIKTAPEKFAEFYCMFLLRVLTELVVILLICLSLVLYQPQILLLFLFIVIPFFIAFFKIVGTKAKEHGKRTTVEGIRSNSILLENVGAFIDVILANKERKFSKKFLSSQNVFMDSKAILAIYNTIPKQMRDLVLIIGIITILSVSWFFDKSNSDLVSTLGIFALCAYRLIPAISNVSFFLLNLKNFYPQIQPLLALSSFSSHSFKEVQPLLINKSISFKNISFSFPDERDVSVLKNISFTVKKGEKIGIIGTSGSGKTTFLNILLRLLRENNGLITIDGQPLKENMDAAFQKNIGYVQQQVFIKNGTLQENIAFGEEVNAICKDRLYQAIKDALLLDFTKDHPKGINMLLGENGVRLSGGQKQRVGIARVLYKQAQVLVFDEPTSALDMETEHAIMDTIQHLTKTDKTIFIVAHRISTLSTCNRIYELEAGRIVRTITYKELFEEKMVLS